MGVELRKVIDMKKEPLDPTRPTHILLQEYHTACRSAVSGYRQGGHFEKLQGLECLVIVFMMEVDWLLPLGSSHNQKRGGKEMKSHDGESEYEPST